MAMFSDLSDKQLLSYLQANDNQSFDLLYRRCYPSVEQYVLQNSGDYDQAQDLFQETLLIVVANVRNPSFQLTSSLKTYVFAISKNLWMSQLKRSARWTGLEDADETCNVTAPVEIDVPPTAYEIAKAILAKLTVRCVTLLSAIFFDKKEITDIMKDGHYASLHSAQNQKYKCLQQARKVGGQRVTPQKPDK